MSESKKTAKQINDVSKPGKTAPPLTSRPVIITNRDMMKDPMVVNAASDKEETESTKPEKVTDTKPSAPSVPKSERVIIPLSESADTKIEKATAPQPDEESANDSDSADPEDNAESTTPEEEPKPEVTDETPDVAEQPATEKPAEPAAEPEKNESDESTTAPDKDIAPTDAQIEAAAMAEAAHDASVQKLVESKKYYLPVNSVEKRRTQRVVILGVVLSVVLILAWVDIALDAGLIQIDSVKPVTHFFSN